MATKKITDLQLRDEVTDDLSIPSDDGIQSYRVTGSQMKSYVLAAGNVLKAALATAVQNALTPTGAVIAYAGGTAPSGFLHCDGSAVSRTTYADLFAAIGTAHGTGDGTTTFNLPDYRGRFLRGWSDGQTRDPDRASRTAMATGGATGDNIGSVQTDATARPNTNFTTGTESAGHTHATTLDIGGNLTNGNIGTRVSTGIAFGQNSTMSPSSGGVSANHTHTVTGGGDNETRPENAYVMYCIKT